MKQRSSLAFCRICPSRFLLWFECVCFLACFIMCVRACVCMHIFFCWNLAVPWMYVCCWWWCWSRRRRFYIAAVLHYTQTHGEGTEGEYTFKYQNELLVQTHKRKIAVQQVAVSSFHTISINFSLSLLYTNIISFFRFFSGWSIFRNLGPESGPHAFMTCIMMKRNPIETVFQFGE